ncbi:MAG: hypothetical protein Q4G48_07415 [Bacteroidia bacterium]|nr:hypothetical protein [Bacteroidia bacterium]
MFASYIGAISFFTHTHIVNSIAYVHSHPFKKGEKTHHTHTDNQLFLLELSFHTHLTPDVVPEFDLSDKSDVYRDINTVLYEGFHSVKNQVNTLLRAPPAA